MNEINIKELPDRYLKSLKQQFKKDLIQKYKLMGLTFDLSNTEIESEFYNYLENIKFYYNNFKMRYYYAEIKFLTYK